MLERFSLWAASTLNGAGGVTLTCMMFLTVADVVLRYAGRPITGTYELMAMAGALMIGLTIPRTTVDGAHVNVDIMMVLLPEQGVMRKALKLLTRLIGLGLFVLLAWALFLKGNDLRSYREVSLTLRLPLYPVAYALSVCCGVQCIAILSRMLQRG